VASATADCGTLSAIANDSNSVMAFFAMSSSGGFVADGGWSTVSDVGITSPSMTLSASYRIGSSDVTPTGTWSTNAPITGLAIELKHVDAPGLTSRRLGTRSALLGVGW
jgi:hypothetical protein